MMWQHYDMYYPGPFGSIMAFLFYFLPTIIAFYRGHHNTFPIFLLNFFLGWSGLGWIIALIWSFTMVQKQQ